LGEEGVLRGEHFNIFDYLFPGGRGRGEGEGEGGVERINRMRIRGENEYL